MICEKCKAEGKSSKVSQGVSVTTAAHYPSFYAEDGSGPHRHDSNRRTQSYECSNGHQWSAVPVNHCPACSWTSAPSVTPAKGASRD